MADQQIEDLTELTSIAANDEFVINDKSDTTDDAGGSTKRVLYSTMGGLETKVSSADSDVSAEVGVINVINISGYTAVRTWSLPTTAAVGDRCAVMISTGDDAYELAIRTTAASNDTINGVDHDSSDFTKLFITGETMVFRCVVANTDWIVEYDGRISCKTVLNRNTAQSIPNNTLEKILLNNSVTDVGNLGDPTTNNRIDIRRNGTYTIRGSVGIPNLDDQEYTTVGVYVNGVAYLWFRICHALSFTGTEVSIPSGVFDFVDGDYIELFVQHTQGAAQNTITTPTAFVPRLEAIELL